MASMLKAILIVLVFTFSTFTFVGATSMADLQTYPTTTFGSQGGGLLGANINNFRQLVGGSRFSNVMPQTFSSASSAGESNTVTLQKYAKLPLSFERHSSSEFVARGQGYVVNILGARATIALTDSHTVAMEFVHGRQGTAIPEKELPGRVNYILSKDPRQ